MQPAENSPMELGHRLEHLHVHPAIDCQPSEQVWAHITQRLDQRAATSQPNAQPMLLRLKQPKWMLSIAASLLLLMGFGWLALQPKGEAVTVTQPIASFVEPHQQPMIAQEAVALLLPNDLNDNEANTFSTQPAMQQVSPLVRQPSVTVLVTRAKSANGENGPHYYFQQGMENFHQHQYCLSKDHLTKARSFLCEHDKLTHEIEQLLEAIDNQIEPPCLCMADRPECNY
jgi:hypothetical protein